MKEDPTQRRQLMKRSQLTRLDPFVDKEGLIRIGGRIRQIEMEFQLKHPLVIPRHGRTTQLIVRWYHHKVKHCGRGITLNELRQAGFWVINGCSVVKFMIQNCVTCRALRGIPNEQKMADLPEERLIEAAPFTYVGVDVFGPFQIKEKRKVLKRYGVIFTCLASRAVHLESTASMETDTFILALRRLVARRGNVMILRSDNGTNFVGANHELSEAFKEMDHRKIQEFMQSTDGDWLVWKFNPPKASHMGGVWERQIRSVRAVLNSILKSHGEALDEESYRTFLCEAECIVNSRPLTTDNLNDSSSCTPLTPNQLLTMKSKMSIPPPGVFPAEDLYSRRRWRRVTHLANEFWLRWKKEYLSSLQSRSKWNTAKRNLEVGDIVLVKDEDCIRNRWPMARVTKTYTSKDGLVRNVDVRMRGNEYNRPIQKLILLVENGT